jgi:TRAP-type C4-dicarboxylate transport system substrate-binding protein
MKIETLKSEFHELIDQINDEEILAQFYDALNRSVSTEGSLWQSLTEEQRQGVLEAYDESKDKANRIPLSAIKSKFDKWPLK